MVRPQRDAFSPGRIRAAYDAVATDYEDVFGGDLAHLPLDRDMLDLLRRVVGDEPILDLGCGTGSAAACLRGGRGRVVGADLSSGMLLVARAQHGLPVVQGDMRTLPIGDGSFGGVVGYYSVQHVLRSELPEVLREAARVLKPQGSLLLSAHLGAGEVFIEEFLGHRIARTGGTLYSPYELKEALDTAGFAIERMELREPLDHEYESRRVYLLAERSI